MRGVKRQIASQTVEASSELRNNFFMELKFGNQLNRRNSVANKLPSNNELTSLAQLSVLEKGDFTALLLDAKDKRIYIDKSSNPCFKLTENLVSVARSRIMNFVSR